MKEQSCRITNAFPYLKPGGIVVKIIDTGSDLLKWFGRAAILVVLFYLLVNWFFNLGIWNTLKLFLFDAF